MNAENRLSGQLIQKETKKQKELSCPACNLFTHFNRKCMSAHFLLVFPHLWLAVGADGGQQVQHGQDGARVNDHHVGHG